MLWGGLWRCASVRCRPMAAAAAKAMNQHPGRLPLVLMLTPGTPWCVVQAREAYEQACKLEPNDAQLQLALQRSAAREGKQVAEGKHTFKRKLDAGGGSGGGGGGGAQEKRPQTVRPSAAKKEKTLLSFGGDEEEEQAE